MSSVADFEVLSYVAHHRQAVRDICAATAWNGAAAPEVIGDEWIWSEFWTRYFTDREPQHAWVVRHKPTGDIVGYLLGTTDVRRVDRYMPWLLPGIAWRVIRGRLLRRAGTRRPLMALARSFLRGELDLPPGVRDRYPATWHFNLLPIARGRGVGRLLFDRFIIAVRAAGVRGIHAQTLNNNAAVTRVNESAGLRIIHTQPITCFAHASAEPLAIHTWVQDL